MNLQSLEIDILRTMAADNLQLAAKFIGINNPSCARAHVCAALKNIDSFEKAVGRHLQATIDNHHSTHSTPSSSVDI
jgi:hypothetical protein